MRIVLQRVTRAEVRVERVPEAVRAEFRVERGPKTQTLASIGLGLVALIAVEREDDESTVATAIDKLSNVRCFPDEDGRMNLDPARAGAEFLLVSQFTLAARLDRGRRPSFERAAPPPEAEELLVALADGLRREGHEVSVGRFGAHMEVELVNDGPVTLILEL